MTEKEITDMRNLYCRLLDRQFAVYTQYAKKYDLTTNELFVLDIIWFSPNGCTQKEICDRLSYNKQTIAAIIGRFFKKGYITLEEVTADRRNKNIRLTESGKAYARNIIPPVVEADNNALTDLGIENAAELVRLTAAFTENMENRNRND